MLFVKAILFQNKTMLLCFIHLLKSLYVGLTVKKCFSYGRNYFSCKNGKASGTMGHCCSRRAAKKELKKEEAGEAPEGDDKKTLVSCLKSALSLFDCFARFFCFISFQMFVYPASLSLSSFGRKYIHMLWYGLIL